MSGSSLDGLDIVCTTLEEVRGQWRFDIVAAACIPYSADWLAELKQAPEMDAAGIFQLHTRYGRYLGHCVTDFIVQHQLQHKVHFIASHGHTVFHNPVAHTTVQIGDGASVAAITGLPVISDLRALDIALGGQGAPIVPIGDQLLFGNYDYWLNIGGIVNISVQTQDQLLAWDICPGNQLLNALAGKAGHSMDRDGLLAAQGQVLPEVAVALAAQDYYRLPPPKSLSNEAAMQLAAPALDTAGKTIPDLLHTSVQHIAGQVAAAISAFPHRKDSASIFITGGGALNQFLIAQLQQALDPLAVILTVPGKEVVQFKEALVMALIGTLRWREETNVLSSVTGASRDSVGGALWMGQSYNGE